MEADLFPLHRPEKADEIEGSIGELSQFHETYSYYAQGVGPETAVLAEGWRDRLVPLKNENTDGRTGWCLEATDLAVSKLIAFREKDRDFVGAMLDHGLIDIEQVVDRLAKVPGEEKRRLVARQWIVSRRSSI